MCPYARYFALRTLQPQRAYVNTEKSHTNNTMKLTLSVCKLFANMRIASLLRGACVWFLVFQGSFLVLRQCILSNRLQRGEGAMVHGMQRREKR